MDESDSALVQRARAGQLESAFGALYDRHKDEVHGYLVRFLGDPELAEEALQESFFRAYRGLATFDASRPFRPWLHQVVRNTALDLLRARTKARAGAERASERPARGASVEPLQELVRREAIAGVGEALSRLPDETRALLLQRHGLGLKLDELAQAWSVTERTLRTRLHEAAGELARLVVAARRPKNEESGS